MRKLAILFFAMIFSAGLYAQSLTGKLSGTVSSDGQPLVGANVILEGTLSGAATDANGTYYIFDVQPGIYTLRVNYIGYKSQIVSNVRVTIGLTTNQDFEMEVAAVEGETVEVTAEKPLIEVTATNVARTIDSEAIDNYAVRSVESMVASQAGVVKMHDGLHLRGSRSEEIGYTLEGASMTGAGANRVVSNAIPEALEAIAVQTGGFDASIGKANAGMVQQSLKTGGSKYSASVLMENMSGGDPWAATGDQDITFTAQGPIGDKIRFFGALRQTSTDNYKSQSRWFTPFTIANGDPIPDKIGGLTASGDYVVLNEGNSYTFTDVDHDGAYTSEGDGRLRGSNKSYAFDNVSKDLSFNGTLQLDFNPLVLRLAGTYNTDTYSSAGLPIQSMFNTRRHETQTKNSLLNLKATYFLNSNTYIRTNVRTMGRSYESYDKAFKDAGVFKTGGSELKDWLKWGDRDEVAKVDTNWSNHFGTPGEDSQDPIYKYVEPSNYNINGFRFQRDGMRRDGYSKGEDGYIGFDAEFVTQMGEHEIKIGGDYTKYTYKRYSYTGINSLNSKIGQDSTLYDAVVAQSARVETEILNARLASWVGYDMLGRDCGSGNCDDYDQPRNPWNMSFYVNDKFEAGDLIVNVGLRYEAINQANVDLMDYNNPPLDKNYTIVAADHATMGFKDMPTQTYLLPRIGLGFPITDRSTFHLNYGRYVQMAPMSRLYRSRGSGTSSWGLKPVRETKFEMGYGTLIGDLASVDITVFARNPQDQISRDIYEPDPTQNFFGLRDHTNYVNTDFSNIIGVEFDFKTSRVGNIQLFANYVFQDVRGTNSYPSLGTIGWGKTTMIAATRYDQRHQASAVLDFRTGRTGNMLTDNLGANLIASLNSGHPYTLSDGSMGQRDAGEGALLSDNDPRNRRPVEAINSSTTPSYFNLDIGLDKTFNIAGTNVKVYATIENLLNTQHIINVYNRTGDAYDDGFLSDPDLSSKIIANRGPEYVEMYQKINLANRNHWLNDHSFDLFGIPREIKTGIQVSF
ncbi:MAG: TonB-dependent receptor [Candidatus Marinimicrobia bacterium]|nr:TonB-dependent receptor [Candidatus Neomarinimicrobiota bacterium]